MKDDANLLSALLGNVGCGRSASIQRMASNFQNYDGDSSRAMCPSSSQHLGGVTRSAECMATICCAISII